MSKADKAKNWANVIKVHQKRMLVNDWDKLVQGIFIRMCILFVLYLFSIWSYYFIF
jgi:hypothetical protein